MSPVSRSSDTRTLLDRIGSVVALGLTLVGGGIALAVLRHRIFVSHDSLISYARVWYVSRRLFHAHTVPFLMPLVEHGTGQAFPYGFVPWTTAALLRPLLGDRVVTMWLVAGAVGVVAGTRSAFPELRRSWWCVATLLNPAVVTGLLIGQLPFLWAAALLLFGIGRWRQGHRRTATVLVALAMVTHVAVVGPIALGTVIVGAFHERSWRPLVGHFAVACLVALPAAIVVLSSPVFADSTRWQKAFGFVDTVGPRSLVVVIPLVLLWMQDRWTGGLAGVIAAAIVAAELALSWSPLGVPWAWRGLQREPSVLVDDFLGGPTFHAGRTYRVLRTRDGRVTLYRVLQAGGRLDGDFFPESLLLRSWPDPVAYSAVLRARKVDEVVAWDLYDRDRRVNEGALLMRMSTHRPARCDGREVCVTLLIRRPGYRVFAIDRH